MRVASLVVTLMVWPAIAHAVLPEEEKLVEAAVQSGMHALGFLAGNQVEAIYVGRDGMCEAVTIIRPRQRMDHFRWCGEDGVIPRSTVSPVYPDDKKSVEVARALVERAIFYGHQHASWAGFELDAMSMGSVGRCQNVELKISYDRDLVSIWRKRICNDDLTNSNLR